MSIAIEPAALHRLRRFKAEELNRLLRTAEEAQIRIVVTRTKHTQIAVEPGTAWAYEVTVDGCECVGFRVTGRCPHHAMLLNELGLIEDPEAIGWPEHQVVAMVAD
jgi:predicted Rdx family selenoprotein